MVLKFKRNPAKGANDDISEVVFMCADDKLQLTYHKEYANIAASTRDFIKPPNWDEKGAILTWSSDMHGTFQVRLRPGAGWEGWV